MKLSFFIMAFFSLPAISCYKNSASNNSPDSVLSPTEFIAYTVNGNSYLYVKPTDNINADGLAENMPFNSSGAFGDRLPAVLNEVVRIHYEKAGIAIGSQQMISLFYTSQSGINTSFTNSAAPLLITITEYGFVG